MSLLLIAVGAILKFAVIPHAERANLDAVGVILTIVGGVGLAITLILPVRGRSPGAPPRPELR